MISLVSSSCMHCRISLALGTKQSNVFNLNLIHFFYYPHSRGKGVTDTHKTSRFWLHSLPAADSWEAATDSSLSTYCEVSHLIWFSLENINSCWDMVHTIMNELRQLNKHVQWLECSCTSVRFWKDHINLQQITENKKKTTTTNIRVAGLVCFLFALA